MTDYDPDWDDRKDFWIVRKPKLRFWRKPKPVEYKPEVGTWDWVLFNLPNRREIKPKIEWLDDLFMPRLVDGRMWGDWGWVDGA